jgi:4,5-DOPA dioxygenase extradiol
MKTRQPVLFLSHGSPMTALGGDELSRTWAKLATRLTRPTAILMISAHWTTRVPLLTGSAQPETIHDFGGFPEALYRLRYPAPGAPELAQRIKQHLTEAGIATGIDAQRGLDHGAWVPLRTLFPEADIPVLQLSVQPERCARHHFALGSALAALPGENILLVASGHMTHNLREYMQGGGERPNPAAQNFRDWIHAQLMRNNDESLLDWLHAAPGATSAHPTPEHFLPLFVALGAAGTQRRTEWLDGGWIEHSLAADNYLFQPA